jgi:hypothetical protein
VRDAVALACACNIVVPLSNPMKISVLANTYVPLNG